MFLLHRVDTLSLRIEAPSSICSYMTESYLATGNSLIDKKLTRLHLNQLFPSIALLAFVVTSLSCATKVEPPTDYQKTSTINRIMNSWVGHYQSELIAAWGPPTKIAPDGEGGNIIVYESLKGTWGDTKDKHVVGGAQYPTQARQSGYAATRTFYADERGIIRSWKWSGL